MFSTPFNFSHSSLNIELFIIVLRGRARDIKRGEKRSASTQKVRRLPGLMMSYFLLFSRSFEFKQNLLTDGWEGSRNVRGLHNFKEFSELPFPKSVLTRLKSVIIGLSYNSKHGRRIFTTVLLPSKHTYRPMKTRCYLKYSLRKDY